MALKDILGADLSDKVRAEIATGIRSGFTEEDIRRIVREEMPESLRDMRFTENDDVGDTLKRGIAEYGQPARAHWSADISAAATDDVWVFDLLSTTVGVSTGTQFPTATFSGGPVIKGTELIGTMANETLTINTTGQIVYVCYTISTDTLSWGIANASNFPLAGSGTFVKPLKSFTLTSDTASGIVTKVISTLATYHKGVIQIDGFYS